MILSLKQKIFIASLATLLVVMIVFLALWWYQILFFGDTLVRYIPSETIVYTHLNTHNESPSEFKLYYENIDEKIFSGTDFRFEKDVLPYISEASFFIFIDPITQKEIPALVVKAKRTPEGKSQIASFIHSDALAKNYLRRNVWVFMKHPDLVEKIRWEGNRIFGSRLKEINGDYYFTFFLNRNWLIKNLSQSFENSSFRGISSLLDLYMSRWQPFLYGALGTRNNKFIAKFSDFSRGKDQWAQTPSFVPLSDFLLYYETVNLSQTLKELDVKMPLPSFVREDRMGVFLSKDHDFVFHFSLKENSEEVIKKELAQFLSQFISGKRKLVLPDGDLINEIIKDPALFLFSDEKNDELYQLGFNAIWKISIIGNDSQFYAAKNDHEFFFASQIEDMALAFKNLQKRGEISISCPISKIFESLEIKKDIFPKNIQPFLHDATYLLSRPTSRGLEIEMCEI